MSRIYRVTAVVVLGAAVGVGTFFAGRQTAPTTTATPQTCQVPRLHAAQAATNGSAGTIEATFRLTNTGSATCVLDGYPRVLLVAKDGSAAPTSEVRGGGLSFEDIGPSLVSLAPGTAAYFNLGYSDVMSPCSVATALQITPPTGEAHATVTVSPTMRVCAGGTLHVSAVFGPADTTATGTSAQP